MGRFLDSLKETVTINGEGSQKITIMEIGSADLEAQGYILQDIHYMAFLNPPNYNIAINDLLTRQPRSEDNPRGSTTYLQVLTVQSIEIIGSRQTLLLRDRDRTVR